jgi:cyclic pyranopterin phosphate synthase
MPFEEYEWMDRRELLTYEEIARLARVFVGLGVNKIRLTGGEPLLRKNLEELVRKLSRMEGVEELCLTTNGSRLAEKARALREAGLERINVSLDTLDREKFRRMTQRDDLEQVLKGLTAAGDAGFHPIKLNAVIERGTNDDEILPLVEFARNRGFAIRFIEYMDVGNSNGWKLDKVVSKKEILEKIQSCYPLREAGRAEGSAPSVDYRFVDGRGEVGVIASVSEPFCAGCTRARLTADGRLVTCLFSESGHDLKSQIRSGVTDDELREFIGRAWHERSDRYSEQRLEAMKSPKGYQAREHRKFEMIVLGG